MSKTGFLVNEVEKIRELRTENKQLKKALEQIEFMSVMVCDRKPTEDYACEQMQELAKQALKKII